MVILQLLAIPASLGSHRAAVRMSLLMSSSVLLELCYCKLAAWRVLQELLACRYEREVNQGKRPVLKAVLEQDQPAARPMVLCICAIAYRGDGQLPPQTGIHDLHAQQQQAESAKSAGKQAQVQLTDGWYGIRAILDIPLTSFLQKGLLQLGEHKPIVCALVTGGCAKVACEARQLIEAKLYVRSLSVSDAILWPCDTNPASRSSKKWFLIIFFCHLLCTFHLSYCLLALRCCALHRVLCSCTP